MSAPRSVLNRLHSNKLLCAKRDTSFVWRYVCCDMVRMTMSMCSHNAQQNIHCFSPRDQPLTNKFLHTFSHTGVLLSEISSTSARTKFSVPYGIPAFCAGVENVPRRPTCRVHRCAHRIEKRSQNGQQTHFCSKRSVHFPAAFSIWPLLGCDFVSSINFRNANFDIKNPVRPAD